MLVQIETETGPVWINPARVLCVLPRGDGSEGCSVIMEGMTKSPLLAADKADKLARFLNGAASIGRGSNR